MGGIRERPDVVRAESLEELADQMGKPFQTGVFAGMDPQVPAPIISGIFVVAELPLESRVFTKVGVVALQIPIGPTFVVGPFCSVRLSLS